MHRPHPARAYFVLTFAVSWAAALAVAAPDLTRGHAPSTLVAILMFPAMLIGPCGVGIALTLADAGRAGWRDLWARVLRWRIPLGWYAVLLIPLALVPLILAGLTRFVSPVYAPNHFWLGVVFGLPAGYFEEIGWTGYAYPALLAARGGARRPALVAAIVLGVFWALWHLPVSDYLGAAHPHGADWPAFFLAFALAMCAMRVLICWAYRNTQSVLLAQLIHASSTGALVVFGAARVTPGQEALWYALYGLALWAVVALVVARFGADLRRPRATASAATSPTGALPEEAVDKGRPESPW